MAAIIDPSPPTHHELLRLLEAAEQLLQRGADLQHLVLHARELWWDVDGCMVSSLPEHSEPGDFHPISQSINRSINQPGCWLALEESLR